MTVGRNKRSTRLRTIPLPIQTLNPWDNNVTKSNYIYKLFVETCVEFCRSTSLHGFKFIFEKLPNNSGKSVYYRRIRQLVSFIMWVTIVSAGAAFAAYLMWLVWIRFQSTPTITTVETNDYPIWNVPFPAVTICNINSVYKPSTENITKILLSRGIKKDRIEQFLYNLANLITFKPIETEFVAIFNALDDLKYTPEKLMLELVMPCDLLLKKCNWLGKDTECNKLFRLAKTSEGFCCSFNYRFPPSIRRIRQLVSFVLWVTIVSSGLFFGAYLMWLVWNRFQSTPTITTIESNSYPIWNMPFPAVTICNINSVYKPNTENLTKTLLTKGIPHSQIDMFLSSLGRLITFRPIENEFIKVFDVLEGLNYTTEKLMLELVMPCEELIKKCIWQGKDYECNKLFRLAKSSEGFCCSFNYRLSLSQAFRKNNSTEFVESNEPVMRTTGAGEEIGLQVVIDVQRENYVADRKPFYGADILIHDANDFPELELVVAVGQPGYDIALSVGPSVVATDIGVKSLSLSRRLCRFDDEKTLKISRDYSSHLCMTECRVLSVFERCNCLPYFYPEIFNGSTQDAPPQCTLLDLQCLSDNKHIFYSLQPPLKEGTNNTDIGMNCDCFPSCTERKYDVSAYTARRFAVDDEISPNDTLVKVFFQDLYCIKYRREMYMSWDGLLASFGGIFGLCLGGSVLSLIEFIYFITFKFSYKIIGYKSKMVNNKNVLSANTDFLSQEKIKPFTSTNLSTHFKGGLPDKYQMRN